MISQESGGCNQVGMRIGRRVSTLMYKSVEIQLVTWIIIGRTYLCPQVGIQLASQAQMPVSPV